MRRCNSQRYTVTVIKGFAHKGLERFFVKDDRRLLDAKQLPRIERILDALEHASSVTELDIPGFKLHKLTGNRKDTWSIRVTGNWRITFRFENGDAHDVNLEDYH